MRKEEEIRRALEIVQRSTMTAFMQGDGDSFSRLSIMLGVLSWIFGEELGESLQESIGQCNAFDAAKDKAAVN